MNRLTRNALVGAALSIALVGGASADILTFTDQAAWEAALSGSFSLHEETFDGDAVSYAQQSTGNPIGALTLDLVGVGESSGIGLTGTGFFEGEVDSSDLTTGDGQHLRFGLGPTFGFGLLGLQNDSATLASGLDLEEIGLIIDGIGFLLSDILGLSDPTVTGRVDNINSTAAIPFVGFVSDSALDSFLLTDGNTVRAVRGGSEEFYLDGVIVARHAALASVPEPATAPLALLGLTLIVARRRGSKLRTKR